MKLVVDGRLSVQPRPVGFSLLGLHPPVNEPVMQRMHRPLLQAPYELLPAPSLVERMDRPALSSMERMDRPPLPASPPQRSVMHMQSPGGFHREPSPPRFDLTVFIRLSVPVLVSSLTREIFKYTFVC